MAIDQPNGATKRQKPDKPQPDFPLFPHASGQWAKRIQGKTTYFGKWDDPAAALQRYTELVGHRDGEASEFIRKPSRGKGSPDGQTAARDRRRPKKPHRDYPLFPHSNGQWAKKLRQRMHYFGSWDDPDGALKRYLEQKDDLLAGRQPRAARNGLTVRDLANRFLTHKHQLAETGEIRHRTFDDYQYICELVAGSLGADRFLEDLRSDDFEKLRTNLARARSSTSLKDYLTRARMIFRYANEVLEVEPAVRYKHPLRLPSRVQLRRARNTKAKRMFEAENIQRLLGAASQPLKAMIHLGINGGLGNEDCGRLPNQALDLDHGWLDFPRPKTGIEHRIPLWPETVTALREALSLRPDSTDKSLNDLVFLTSQGNCWAKDMADSPISKEMTKLLKKLKLHRPGLGFYALRHTFETIGGESRDQVAVDAIMGHAPDSDDMASVYREQISDERLKAVTQCVRAWLFRKAKKPAKKSSKTNRRGNRKKMSGAAA